MLASCLAAPSTCASAHYEKTALNWESTLSLQAHFECINKTGLCIFVQVLDKVVNLRGRLDPCLHAIGEGASELGWIQESRFVSVLVQFNHVVFVLRSSLQRVGTVIFVESDLVLLVEQVTPSASLTDEQVLYLEAVKLYDDRSWLFSFGRLGCEALMGMIELRG